VGPRPVQTECVTLGLERKVIGPMGYCVSVFVTTMWVPNLLNVINPARLNETLNQTSFPFSILFQLSRIFDRSTCSKRSKESLFSAKKKRKLPRAIYSILVYFTMFSFQVLTCSRIVSIRIILILNKFRHV